MDSFYEGQFNRVDFDDWEDHIASQKYVLMPLIDRGGACVIVDIGTEENPNPTLGCLIKFPDLGTQLNHTNCHYQALVKEDNSIVRIYFMDIIDSLVAIGTVLYLNAEVIQDDRFNHQSRRGKWLHTRLNIPNVHDPIQGKLYVTGIYRRHRTRTQVALTSSVTFAVNPWDLIAKDQFTGPAENIMKYLD